MGVEKALSIDDLRRMAKRRLPKVIFDFLEGGAEDEKCIERICEAFHRQHILPRYLVDISKRDQSCTLFGETYAAPFGIGPTGMIALTTPGADLMLAEAANAANVPFIMSGSSTASMGDVIRRAPKAWMQLYVPRDLNIYTDYLKRTDAAGFKVLVFTVDVPAHAKRERNIRAGFVRPYILTLPIMLEALLHPGWLWNYFTTGGLPYVENWLPYAPKGISPRALTSFYAAQIPAPQDWRLMAELRRLWPGKFVVKGIMHPDDARKAVELGADGIIVSNHGGRQLDRSPAPIDVFPDIDAAVGARTILMLDSGIRRGSDVVAALCNGAKFTFVGRATAYGVSAGKTKGASRAIEILKGEIDLVLAQMGCPNARDLGPQFLYRQAKKSWSET